LGTVLAGSCAYDRYADKIAITGKPPSCSVLYSCLLILIFESSIIKFDKPL